VDDIVAFPPPPEPNARSAAAALEELNEPQARAAGHVDGPLLVFAGAGSGKTRVITYRIANLVAVVRVPPYRVLAVTFTNKAAGEMRHRLQGLIGEEVTRDLWVGTFHAVCVRLLRRYHEAAGLERSFVIYDDSDQRAVMARVLKELDLDDRRYPPRQLLARIHREKQEARGPDDFRPEGYVDDVVGKCFHAYQRHLKDANAVDFEDIILRIVQIVEDRESPVAAELRRRFRHVLVDEFQDVNMAQYRLVRAFAGESQNLCVVGDDDQSIYRWRGADVRNIRNFRRDFPAATVVKLEQNYRSTGNIVRGALGVIRPAKDREPKELWTARQEGEPILVVAAENERDEAAWVVDRIKTLIGRGVSPRDVAVFYRVHAQSRVIEEVMRAERVPYQIIGGTKFFDRAEVKSLLAYLRVISNPRSDVDLDRIINVPPRKIGATTVERLRAKADERRTSLYDAIEPLCESGEVGTAAKKSLLAFRDLLQRLMGEARTASPRILAEEVLEQTGFGKALEQEDSAESDARIQNLQELLGSIAEYEMEMAAAGEEGTLAGYLERVTLASDADQLADTPKVPMMTVHAAKGLEFHAVFVTGMEEEVFPFRGLDPKQADELEEERRLAYVALTRARELLYLTHTQRRMIFGTTRYGIPSRFVADLPKSILRPITTDSARQMFGGFERRVDRAGPTFQRSREPWSHPFNEPGEGSSRPAAFRAQSSGLRPRNDAPPPPLRSPGERYVEHDATDEGEGGVIRAGARVRHEKFGAGTVVSVDHGDDPIATVRFSGRGEKRIKLSFLRW
jgi:DNA helicase II / ATP-dependent DNA helicase PcrA